MSGTASKICVAGKNEIAVNAVLHLVHLGLRDRLVVCPNRSDTRSSHWQPSLCRLANELEIEIIDLEKVESMEDVLFISLEFDRIVKPASFASDRLYNIHFSRLPAYKGMYTSAHPILRGEAVSGVTLHKIDHGIDTGAIIAQKDFSIGADWTARDLYFEYMKEGYELFLTEIRELIDGTHADPAPQDCQGSTYFDRKSIDFGNLEISLRDTAEGIVRQLRAFSFREFQSPIIADMKVGSWDILGERSLSKPGSIRELDAESLVISSIDYDLLLTRDRSLDWFQVAGSTPPNKVDELNKTDIDNRNTYGWSPLIVAAYSGDAYLVERLLSCGADPNRTNPNGTTPLMYAHSSEKKTRKSDVIQKLMAHGADASKRDLFEKSLADYHGRTVEASA